MRHRNYGKKLSRKTEHRRALLRNLVTSLILTERIETTVAKAKAARPLAEHMITLGKQGDLLPAAWRQATCWIPAALKSLFGDIAKRYADRRGGYTRIVRAGWRKATGLTWPSWSWWVPKSCRNWQRSAPRGRKPSRRRRKRLRLRSPHRQSKKTTTRSNLPTKMKNPLPPWGRG